MANVDWASNFFQAVTSKLPDLLTKHGEGKEMAALDELREELGKADKEAKAERAKVLQAELDQLSGKPTPLPAMVTDAAPAVPPAEDKAEPAKRTR